MRARNRTPRPIASGSRPQLSFDPRAAATNTFQAALSSYEQVRLQETSTDSISTIRGAKPLRWQDICSGALSRAWSFVHARYKISTTKRLRVSETISLGEKRFVAIVAVEGREFLIGGGVSGMSLLAQLGSTAGSTNDLVQKFGDSGGAL